MNAHLKEILAEKRHEVNRIRKQGIPVVWHGDMPSIRDFPYAISSPHKVGLIAEIKFASPTAGRICQATDPVHIARLYEGHGAAAISYLTDKRFFGGDLRGLPRIKTMVSLPILRKDFIIDEVQVVESAVYGADAVLLIARILSKVQLKDLVEAAKALHMCPLVEVHDARDLDKALSCGAEIIGINNRNLDTFEVDLNTTFTLRPMVPEECIVVSESGIGSAEEVRRLGEAGVHAVLVGTAIMKAQDMEGKVRELASAGGMPLGSGQGLRHN